jgi:hypothetical protein
MKSQTKNSKNNCKNNYKNKEDTTKHLNEFQENTKNKGNEIKKTI